MNVEIVALHEATRHRYLNYAMSVITSRALPDVRDGLKPVQRRILYAMYHNLRLLPDNRFRKSAAVVGEVMAKYHPHGDSAIYDAMVRMAQSFSLRHPLVSGQGNFGSLDGDAAAAMRYTECRLSPIAIELLSELKQKTIGYRPSYDGQHFEPIVLPAQFPQLLVNGAEGIAVGMATRIPPHNLREVIDAATILIDNEDAEIADMMRVFKGPDFPTGGSILNNRAELQEMYEQGGGSIRLQGDWTLEIEGRSRLVVVTSIPYGLNKSTLIEKIGDLIASRRVPQLQDIRDESTDDVRIVMVLRGRQRSSPEADAAAAMAYLYKHTPLQMTFPMNLTCLVPTDNPEVCAPIRADLKTILRHWLDFRHHTVRQRFRFELQRLEERIHILEGFARIFDVLDEVIVIIRDSDGKRDSANKLIARFAFSEEQVEAILELKLYRLARLEVHAVEEELEAKQADAARIRTILASTQSLWSIVRQELQEIRRLYGERRRTSLGGEEIAYEESAYIVAEDTYLIVTREGWLKRQGSFTSIDKIRIRDGDGVMAVALADTRKTVAFFTDRGAAYVMRLDGVPSTTGYGDPIQKHFSFSDGERLVGVIVHDERALPSVVPTEGEGDDPPPPYGIAITRKGKAMRFSVGLHVEPSNRTGRRYAKLDGDDDAVVAVYTSDDTEQVSVASARGRGLCFPVSEISLNRGPAKGVMAMRLDARDWIHGFELARSSDEGITVETPRGREERIQPGRRYTGSRATKGRVIMKTGTFKPWQQPMMRFDQLHEQPDDGGEE
ncbi:MAG: DNA gyrase subunit A [Myxococcota bacterium]